MRYHMIAFLSGFLLDLLIGDPEGMFHPIRLIGGLIAALEKRLLKKDPETGARNPRKELWAGAALVVIVLAVTGACAYALLYFAYRIHPYAGVALEAVMTGQILATKSLRKESTRVYDKLASGDLAGARKAVSMIVGRDTGGLDATGVAKAAVETVAENTADGVVAPMLYLALGGPVLGFLYKAVNTMDSMVGYKNDRYLYFGRAAARLDDVLNFIPSRVSAALMILTSFLAGKDFSGRRAWRIFCRDRYQHASPNSAQTEAVCAGALGTRLAGDAYYFGKLVRKPTLGDDIRPVEYKDIARANRLLYGTAGLCAALCAALMLIFI